MSPTQPRGDIWSSMQLLEQLTGLAEETILSKEQQTEIMNSHIETIELQD